MLKFPGFVAVHAGAGFHGEDCREETQTACRRACSVGLASASSSLSGCVSAIGELENCPITNAGLGSNISMRETVECDAGIMEGKTLRFAGIGAVSGIRNPVILAQKLLELQANNHQSLVPPNLLVGEGAADFAKSIGHKIVSSTDLITKDSLNNYRKALARFQNGSNPDSNPKMDTVGAVCLGPDGKSVAAGVSSGGLILKHPGRVGHAALFGCGCWAEEAGNGSVAVSVSGCGEFITRTNLARSCAETLISSSSSNEDPLPVVLQQWFKEHFLDSRLLQDMQLEHKLAGVLVLFVDRRKREAELAWIHNTKTMCVGYVEKKKLKCKITELSPNSSTAVYGCNIDLFK